MFSNARQMLYSLLSDHCLSFVILSADKLFFGHDFRVHELLMRLFSTSIGTPKAIFGGVQFLKGKPVLF